MPLHYSPRRHIFHAYAIIFAVISLLFFIITPDYFSVAFLLLSLFSPHYTIYFMLLALRYATLLR